MSTNGRKIKGVEKKNMEQCNSYYSTVINSLLLQFTASLLNSRLAIK